MSEIRNFLVVVVGGGGGGRSLKFSIFIDQIFILP